MQTSRSTRRLVPALVLVLALLALAAPPASAAGGVERLGELPATPARYRVSAEQALALAAGQADVRRAARDAGQALRARVTLHGPWEWEVDVRRDGHTVVGLLVDGRVPRVTAVERAREAGHVAGRADSGWIWALLCVAFAAPFVDPRRWRRLVHLDVAVLLSFGLSHIFLTRGDLTWSVPLVYPALAYLLVRMLLVARGRRAAGASLVPYAPTWLLAAGAVAFTALQAALAIGGRMVMDIGYFSVVGADRIMTGEPLYAVGGSNGDTYGALNYIAYVPFELLWPWTEGDLRPAAATAAAIAWQLAITGLLLLAGRRLRPGPAGIRLGVILAYAWATYPYAMYATAMGVNDGLVAALVLGAVIAAATPMARGGLVGLAAAVKFSPAALLPLMLRGRSLARGPAIAASAAFAVAFAFPFLGHVPDGGLREIWECTMGFQLGRSSPLSPWGQYASLAFLQIGVQVAALAVVAAVALMRSRRDVPAIAALSAAAIIAVQLPATHWFYFYIVWFAPLALVALVAPHSIDRALRQAS
jgi:hypothetical protein